MQNTNTLKNVVNFNSAENSVQLYIDLAHKNLTVNNSKIESITMYADAECAGDLAVNWEAADDADYVHNSVLIMRDNADTNSNTQTMQEFYWESAFDAQLADILLDAGFSKQAVADVSGSEWGMQDAGRASYDAFEIAAEMLALHNIKQVA